MQNKLLGIGSLAFAFVLLAIVPSIATATPVLTEAGAPVPFNKKLKATKTSTIKFDDPKGTGTIECTESVLTGLLVANPGTKIEENIETSSFTSNGGGACTSTFNGSPSFKVDPPTEKQNLCFATWAESKGTITGNVCGKLAAQMEFTMTNGGTPGNCTYVVEEIPFSYPMLTSPLIITVSGVVLKQKAACNMPYPAEFKLSGTWNLTTDDVGSTALEVA